MSRRHHHSSGAQGVMLGLIITPMLDMAFQILSFFIMTYHPSSLEGHIPGSLVAAKKDTAKTDAKETPDTISPNIDDDPSIQSSILIIVESIGPTSFKEGRKDGEPGQIRIREGLATNDTVVSETTVSVDDSLKLLKAELARSAQGDAPKAHARIEAGPDLRNHYLMQIYDLCKQHYGNVHFVPPPPKPKD